ncbi:MAG: hypothetical protein QOK22_2574, partial [Gaiellaceae bacterium]|nr:hypothetical protein [Gaiellaceae bacterium]
GNPRVCAGAIQRNVAATNAVKRIVARPRYGVGTARTAYRPVTAAYRAPAYRPAVRRPAVAYRPAGAVRAPRNRY